MHEDDLGLGRHRGEHRGDRVLTFRAARHDDDRGDRREEGTDGADLGGRGGDDDHAHRGGGRDAADRVDEEGFAGERAEGLGGSRPEAESGTRRRNEDRDVTASIQLRGHVAVLSSEMVLERWWNVRPR
ncbi:hypothetical protein GCM10010166_09410 [Couchioplanes caeruleus subsp. azureus]|nr:hypothetical protein GCM10010166_09410 [Couchioplanes caeruleus subsp. azureus]